MKKTFIGLIVAASLSSTLNAMESNNNYLLIIASQLKKNKEVIHTMFTEYALDHNGFRVNGWDETKEDTFLIDTDIQKVVPNGTSHHIALKYCVKKMHRKENESLDYESLHNNTVFYTLSQECNTTPYAVAFSNKEGDIFDIFIRVFKRIDRRK